MSMRSCILGLLAVSLCFAASTAMAGSITHHSFPSETLGRAYAYNVYLPDNYATSGLSYPVLYLLHGSNGGENGWPVNGGLLQTADRLMADGDHDWVVWAKTLPEAMTYVFSYASRPIETVSTK